MKKIKCLLCGKELFEGYNETSIDIKVHTKVHLNEQNKEWRISSICESCLPSAIEKINSLYEEIIE